MAGHCRRAAFALFPPSHNENGKHSQFTRGAFQLPRFTIPSMTNTAPANYELHALTTLRDRAHQISSRMNCPLLRLYMSATCHFTQPKNKSMSCFQSVARLSVSSWVWTETKRRLADSVLLSMQRLCNSTRSKHENSNGCVVDTTIGAMHLIA